MEGEEHVFFVMELCGGGNLNEYIGKVPLSEDAARYFFSQIVEGVAYSHKAGVAHRDLKLDNILLDNQGKMVCSLDVELFSIILLSLANVKITDFGHAGVYQHGWDVFSTPLVGGLSHIAPEQV